MTIASLLSANAVVTSLKANSKKALLNDICAQAAGLTGLAERELFEILLQRERLGSTGVGDGIAIPHGRVPGLDNMFGMLVRTDRPVDFEALDGQPVDILFVLLAPDHAGADHLKALAKVARLLRDRDVLGRIRSAHDAAAIYGIVTETTAKAA
jgi:nitrogen PTS system EIIA component